MITSLLPDWASPLLVGLGVAEATRLAASLVVAISREGRHHYLRSRASWRELLNEVASWRRVITARRKGDPYTRSGRAFVRWYLIDRIRSRRRVSGRGSSGPSSG
jgi:hypothetical protein